MHFLSYLVSPKNILSIIMIVSTKILVSLCSLASAGAWFSRAGYEPRDGAFLSRRRHQNEARWSWNSRYLTGRWGKPPMMGIWVARTTHAHGIVSAYSFLLTTMENRGKRKRDDADGQDSTPPVKDHGSTAVSYTHLTLPTSDLV